MKRLLFFVVVLFCTASSVHAFTEATWPHHSVASLSVSNSFTSGDLNNDGLDDVLLMMDNSTNFNWYRNQGGGSFTDIVIPSDYGDPGDFSIADMNGDGEMDIVATYDLYLVLYLNQGDEQFLDQVIATANPLKWKHVVVDLDNDGDPDILSCEEDGLNFYENDGGLNFTRFTLSDSEIKTKPVIGDADLDGDLDIFFKSEGDISYLRLLENQGDMTFVEEMLYSMIGPRSGITGYTQDGALRVVFYATIPGEGSGICQLYHDGTDYTAELLLTDRSPWHLATLDVNDDGSSDILFTTNNVVAWFPIDHPDNERFLYIDGPAYVSNYPVLGDFDADGDTDFMLQGAMSFGLWYDSLIWWENPDYRAGQDLRVDLNEGGVAHLTWDPLNAAESLIYRNGDPLTTTTEAEYFDPLPAYGTYEYEVSCEPVSGSPKPSYPRSVQYLNPDHVVFLEDFEDGMPASWVIEDFVATQSWHQTWHAQIDAMLRSGNLMAGFPVPEEAWLQEYDFFGRAVTPSIGIEPGSRVAVSFDHAMRRSTSDEGMLQVSVDGDPWITIETFHVGKSSLEEFDITDLVADANSFRIGFESSGYSTLFYAWSIDNVTVTMTPTPVVLTLTPQISQVPAEGGTVVFDGLLQSNIATPLTNLHFWRTVEFPNGGTYDLPGQLIFDLPAYAERIATGMTVAVPAGAPAGEYTFTGYVGYPNNPDLQIASSFVFVKQGASSTGQGFVFNPADWTVTGNFDLESKTVASSSPNHFALSEPYPNPFNPATTVNVTLPETAPLTVRVFDIQGRTVATLADGSSVAAGSHSFSFDGSDLSSGIYFVQATVPGRLNEVRKLMLVK